MKEKNIVEKNNNGLLVALVIILIIAIVGIIVYMFYDKGMLFNNDKSNVNSENSQINDNNATSNTEQDIQEENVVNEESQTCNGYLDATFYGEYSGNVNGFEILEKRTLTLKSDGTFDEVVENSEGNSGQYNIDNGKLTITYEMPGGNIVTLTRDISNDCSVIINDGDNYTYELKRK